MIKLAILGGRELRKTVLKSALCCFAAIIATFLLVFGVLALFSPVTLARGAKSMGLEKVAVSYYKSAYDKSGDFTVLSELIDVSDNLDDNGVLSSYGLKFISSEEFSKYCEESDKEKDGGVSSYDYYCHVVVEALYKNGDKKTSAETSVKFTYEYTNTSPLKTAIMLAAKNNDDEYADFIVAAYSEREHEISYNDDSLENDFELLKK